jgi:DNA gyrase/topoisomerase IV subunit B
MVVELYPPIDRSMTTTVEKEWEKLSPYRQARLRTEMWLGSRDPHTQVVLEYGPNGPSPMETSWVPALFTAFREVFDNALDETAAHGNGDRVDVSYNAKTMVVSIQDNGRGVPIEFDETEQKHAATVLLSETNAGRNFKDDRGATRGLNGVGGAIVNWCSEYFQVNIVRDGKEFSQRFCEGDEHVAEDPIIFSAPAAKKKQTGTRIEFRLSSKVFKHRKLPESFIRARVYEAALCYPDLKLYYNGSRVVVKSIEKDLFPKHKPITFEIDKEGFKSSFWLVPDFFEDGREHAHSLVNAIPMFSGGVHLDAFRNGFFSGLIAALEPTSKRRKLKPNRSDINDGLLIYNITEMDAPNFDGQAKTRLVNEKVAKLVTGEMADPDFFKSVIRRYPEWIDRIYERCAERTMKKDSADLAKAARANKRLKIVELEDASGTARMNCTLFLCEGKSAVSGITEARDPTIHGALPLRGKVMNVYGRHLARSAYSQHLKKVAENDALMKIASAVGLVVGQKAVRSTLRYGKVYLATDADPDGANIAALLVNYFYQLWPELFDPKSPFLYIFQTPFIIAKKGKVKKYWYSDDYDTFSSDEYKGWEITRAKGLAALKKDDWQAELAKPRVTPVVDDGDLAACLDLLFSPNADARKDWLGE